MRPQLKEARVACKFMEERIYARVASMPPSLIKNYVERTCIESSKQCPAEGWHETARESTKAILHLHLRTQNVTS
jgi:hypothetical protein